MKWLASWLAGCACTQAPAHYQLQECHLGERERPPRHLAQYSSYSTSVHELETELLCISSTGELARAGGMAAPGRNRVLLALAALLALLASQYGCLVLGERIPCNTAGGQPYVSLRRMLAGLDSYTAALRGALLLAGEEFAPRK